MDFSDEGPVITTLFNLILVYKKMIWYFNTNVMVKQFVLVNSPIIDIHYPDVKLFFVIDTYKQKIKTCKSC